MMTASATRRAAVAFRPVSMSKFSVADLSGAIAEPECSKHCGACCAELDRILDAALLAVQFRPVASLRECSVVGHIATVTGPQDALLHSASRLFATAVRVGEIPRLTRQMLVAISGHYALRDGGSRLFLPLPAAAVSVLGAGLIDMLAEAFDQGGLPAATVVAVLPSMGWQARTEDLQRLAAVAAGCQQLGLATSGALGCALSERMLWNEHTPQFVLLDDGQLDGVDADLVAGGALAAELRRAGARGSRIVAQGIAGRRELRVAERLGIDLVAGDYIGRGNVQPATVLAAAAYKMIRQSAVTSDPGAEESVHLLQRLKVDVPPVTPDTPAEAVFAIFERNPQLRAVAVVVGGIPAGLISRYDMIDNMARPYRHELYGRKSCTRFMDREPIAVDVRLSLPELTEIFVHADPRHLVSGFIVTDHGQYAGMGSVQDLMREITSMQIEAARYANPLTQLPGSVPVNQNVDSLLAAGAPFAICYCDLDHFKPFNDVYGYAKGDQVIALTARILAECGEPDIDFVGHVGGDDFILVMRSEDWVARCKRALKLFEEEILGFFNHDDIERGGYVTENRKGALEFHRLTSLSIGAVEVAPGQFANHLQVAGIATEVKKKAKAIAGNSFYVNHRQYAGDGAATPVA
jgi:GGDEF domain-containing protein/EAL domain-containing protein (putative c-di-GMP-specific phosphodiesterase class I)